MTLIPCNNSRFTWFQELNKTLLFALVVKGNMKVLHILIMDDKAMHVGTATEDTILWIGAVNRNTVLEISKCSRGEFPAH